MKIECCILKGIMFLIYCIFIGINLLKALIHHNWAQRTLDLKWDTSIRTPFHKHIKLTIDQKQNQIKKIKKKHLPLNSGKVYEVGPRRVKLKQNARIYENKKSGSF